MRNLYFFLFLTLVVMGHVNSKASPNTNNTETPSSFRPLEPEDLPPPGVLKNARTEKINWLGAGYLGGGLFETGEITSGAFFQWTHRNLFAIKVIEGGLLGGQIRVGNLSRFPIYLGTFFQSSDQLANFVNFKKIKILFPYQYELTDQTRLVAQLGWGLNGAFGSLHFDWVL